MSSAFKYLLVILATITVCTFIYSVSGIHKNGIEISMPWEESEGIKSNYPINLEIRGEASRDIVLVHKVTYDMQKQMYIYYYRVEYIGQKTCLFNWEVLNLSLEQLPTLMELVPGKKQEFTVYNSQPPMMYYGEVEVYYKKENNWHSQGLDVQPGPMPSSYYKGEK